MWGGNEIIHDNLDEFEREEDLKGISTFMYFADLQPNNLDLQENPYFEKAKRINEYSRCWKWLDVLDDAFDYFNYDQTSSVDYSGFLINHDKHVAVSLEQYYNYSKFFDDSLSILAAVDLIPVLTETGGGSHLTMSDGIWVETTENLFGKWCGDLLQISEEPPDGYEIIKCCFADIWQRATYCYYSFGTDNEDFVLDSDKKRYLAVKLDLFDDKRGALRCVKVEETKQSLTLHATLLAAIM
jgi:hypothetical protein